MTGSPAQNLGKAKEMVDNVNTDEEVKEINEALNEAADAISGIGGETLLEEDESIEDDFRMLNMFLREEKAERISEIVEEEFQEKWGDADGVVVLQVKAPNKAVVRIRE